jgi:hypothetical protein
MNKALKTVLRFLFGLELPDRDEAAESWKGLQVTYEEKKPSSWEGYEEYEEKNPLPEEEELASARRECLGKIKEGGWCEHCGYDELELSPRCERIMFGNAN